MSKDAGDTHGTLTQLAVDGGMSDSQYCMQFQADVSGVRVVRPAMRETTCLGAAIAAGLAAGCWRDLDHVADEVSRGKPGRTVFEPRWDRAKSEKLFRRWEHAVEMSRGWVRDEHEESS